MTARRPCPAAPGPLEEYAARFDGLFSRVAQRRGFREYLAGLLAPRDRNKTLTALAGAEPVAGAQHAAVQRLQFFLSESRWDPDRVNARRLELLLADPATAPHGGGVLVVDDSGDRKDGVKTAHVGRQWLGRYGKTDNGVVTVTTVTELEAVLDAGPAAAGYADQCWTLARVAEQCWRRFGVEYTLAGMAVLLHRLGWSVQVPARRAAERDEEKIARWREDTWPVIKARRRTWAPGSAGKMSRARG